MTPTNTPPKYAADFRRAAVPEVCFLEDLALILQMTTSGARRLLLRGQLGPYLRLGRRLAVRRASLLAALEALEVRS